jgi:hypothetical protein
MDEPQKHQLNLCKWIHLLHSPLLSLFISLHPRMAIRLVGKKFPHYLNAGAFDI